MEDYVIGIIGGMGSYATIDFFRRLVDAFPAEKEWERPRIIVDNYCTMPSRVRAILYNERTDELIQDLSSSVRAMINLRAKRIILACNTSHVFLNDVIERVPESEEKILNIIDACGKEIKCRGGGGSVSLIASEGTIQTQIYNKIFMKYSITVNTPHEKQFELIRKFIESVKKNFIDLNVLKKFKDFLDSFNDEILVLGCTELPILYTKCVENKICFSKTIEDPLQAAINIMTKEYLLYKKGK